MKKLSQWESRDGSVRSTSLPQHLREALPWNSLELGENKKARRSKTRKRTTKTKKRGVKPVWAGASVGNGEEAQNHGIFPFLVSKSCLQRARDACEKFDFALLSYRAPQKGFSQMRYHMFHLLPWLRQEWELLRTHFSNLAKAFFKDSVHSFHLGSSKTFPQSPQNVCGRLLSKEISQRRGSPCREQGIEINSPGTISFPQSLGRRPNRRTVLSDLRLSYPLRSLGIE